MVAEAEVLNFDQMFLGFEDDAPGGAHLETSKDVALARKEEEDEALLLRASGIGKKTAGRIILELKDKFRKENLTAPDRDIQISVSQAEAVEALLSLGYTQKEADGVLKTVKADLSVEETIKAALKSLMS